MGSLSLVRPGMRLSAKEPGPRLNGKRLVRAAPDSDACSPLSKPNDCSWLVTFVVVRLVYHGRVRRAAPWDCGYPAQTPRMQDTAEGFGQPIKHIFEPFFRIRRHMPSPFDAQPYYAATTEDRLWHWLYLPIARLNHAVGVWIGIASGLGFAALFLTVRFFRLTQLPVAVTSA